uniref:Uncharacterized protein n=1 Tax=Arundo donax TaxID=35708 RepID=A0A0A9DIW9_ARUDO
MHLHVPPCHLYPPHHPPLLPQPLQLAQKPDWCPSLLWAVVHLGHQLTEAQQPVPPQHLRQVVDYF